MAEAPNKHERWTDTDDAVILIFPPGEAAAILGRTVNSIYCRRCLKNLGRHNTPRKRLRREYFATGDGPREEAIPAQPHPNCRYCARQATRRGLCKACYRWVQRLVEAKVVTWELAERLWLSQRNK